MNTVKNIKTVKSGREYYADVNETRLHYLLNAEENAVMIYSKNQNHGGFSLERFGGRLSPEGIRYLHKVYETPVEITVTFRKFPDGDVIALWDDPDTTASNMMGSYQHIGQHGEAHTDLITDLEPASPEEYAPLKSELEAIGYAVTVK